MDNKLEEIKFIREDGYIKFILPSGKKDSIMDNHKTIGIYLGKRPRTIVIKYSDNTEKVCQTI